MTLAPTRTITTLNVLLSTERRKERSIAIAQRLAQTSPEIVLLQEVVAFGDEGPSEVLDLIAEASGIPAVHYGRFKKMYRKFDNPTDKDWDGFWAGNGILSTLPVLETGIAPLSSEDPEVAGYCIYAVLEDNDKVIIVFNAHGAWGGHRPQSREDQFRLISQRANELEQQYAYRQPITVLGGDFNADPDSSVLRFLTGKQSLSGEGTFWVDAWDHCGEGEGWTTGPQLALAANTARKVGISYPEFMPDRRIDYLLVKGWVYGRRGMPLSIERDFAAVDEQGETVSDHLGLNMDIWTP